MSSGTGSGGNSNGGYVAVTGGSSDGLTAGMVSIATNNSVGTSGQALVSDGATGSVVYGGIYGIAAGVPAGAPVGKLPIAVDTTAVSGGIYVWDGGAWVKAASI